MEMLCVLLVAFLAECKVVTHCAVEAVVACGDGFVALVASEPSIETLSLLVLLHLLFQRFSEFIFVFDPLLILLFVHEHLRVFDLVSVLII